MKLNVEDLKELLVDFLNEEEIEKIFSSLQEHKRQKLIYLDVLDLKEILNKIKEVKNQQLYFGRFNEKNIVVEIKDEFLDGGEYICKDYHTEEIYNIGTRFFLENFKPVIYKIGQTIDDGLRSKINKLLPNGYETKRDTLTGFIPYNYVETYEYKLPLLVIGN